MTNTKPIKFAIYKYFLVETGELQLFEEPCEEARLALESILAQKNLPMVQRKRGSEIPEPLPLADCELRNGIAVIRPQKERNRKEVINYKDGKRQDYPWCWAVIDNRPGIGQLAVQYKSEFGSEHAGEKIVEDSFNALLHPFGLKMEVKMKVQEGEFWETIERLYEKGDYPKSVKFDFLKPQHVGQFDLRGIPEDFVDFQLRLMEMMQVKEGIKSVYMRTAKKGSDLDLHRDKVSDDMAHLITLFCNNGYDLRVKFARFGEYQLGKQMRVWREAPENIFEDFMDGQTDYNEQTGEPEFAILPWLDEVRDSTKTCTDEEIAKLRSKKCRQRVQK